jgi:hypothetical protein
MSPLHRIRVAGRYSMAFAWNEQQVVIVPCIVQRVNDLHRTCCIDIRIQLCDAKHRSTTQSPCIRHIGAFLVALFDGISHPRFVPLHLIHAVVVTPAVYGGDAVEVVIEEKSTHRIWHPAEPPYTLTRLVSIQGRVAAAALIQAIQSSKPVS